MYSDLLHSHPASSSPQCPLYPSETSQASCTTNPMIGATAMNHHEMRLHCRGIPETSPTIPRVSIDASNYEPNVEITGRGGVNEDDA